MTPGPAGSPTLSVTLMKALEYAEGTKLSRDQCCDIARGLVERIDHLKDRHDELTAAISQTHVEALAERDRLAAEFNFLIERLCEVVRLQAAIAT
jgi:hypothetical protein